MFRILDLKFGYYLGFSVLYLGFLLLPMEAEAAIVIQAPKYIGLNSGLVGYWSFDGKDMAGVTAYDRSGNANNGTLTGGPTRAIGKIGQGLSFDGSNDYVSFGNASSLNPATAITISAWINTSAPTTNFAMIVNKDSGVPDNSQYTLRMNGTTGKAMFRAEGAGLITASGNTILNANQWYHVVGTYDGNNTRFYLNGVEDATPASGSGNMTNNSANLEIGRRDDGYYFPGKIDDVRIYNRALSGDEIKRLYRIGATLKINTSINNDSLANGLVGYWSMNAPDVAGTTAYDRSGNSKNGSILGQDIDRTGLVGWWKLDGASSGSIANGTTVGLEDSSGQSNNGTASNVNGTGMAWTTPKIGIGAVDFDGTDDYVSIPISSSLDFVGLSAITMSAWVNTDTVDPGERIIMWEDATDGNGNEISISLSDGSTSAFWKAGGEIYVSPCETAASVTAVTEFPDDSDWVHLTVTYNGSETSIYVNGILDNSVSGSGTLCGADNPNPKWLIGSGELNTTRKLDGLIDDVRVYNRAISAAEVAQLYSYGLPRFVPTAGKIGQGVDSTQSYINPGNVNSSVNSFSLWMKTASSSPTVNLLDLNAGQSIKIVGGAVTASGLTSPSIFVDGASGSTVNAGWHHIAVTTGTAVNASAVNLGLNATTTAPLDGVLDDVRFYNRVINNNEIKRLYRIGATLKINTDVSRDNPDLERGLVGLWSFDGKDMAGVTAYDRSGNANNGTLTGGPTRAIGKIGQGMSFDGVDDYVTMGNPSGLQLSGAVSITAWVYLNSGSAQNGRIVSKWVIGAKAYELSLDDNPGVGLLSMLVSGDGTVTVEASESTTLPLNSWQFVTGVYVPSTSITVYRNGVQVGQNTTSIPASLANPATNFQIGDRTTTNYPWLGKIDDVRIYNRVLNADEIKRLYNLGR